MVVCDQVLNPESIPFTELNECFSNKRSIFGCSFSSEGENLIYGGGQCSYRFFSFSTPFNEDQIVEYLKIILNDSIEGENKQINVQFIHQLLEAYESQKQNVSNFNEEEEVKGDDEKEEEKGDEVKKM